MRHLSMKSNTNPRNVWEITFNFKSQVLSSLFSHLKAGNETDTGDVFCRAQYFFPPFFAYLLSGKAICLTSFSLLPPFSAIAGSNTQSLQQPQRSTLINYPEMDTTHMRKKEEPRRTMGGETEERGGDGNGWTFRRGQHYWNIGTRGNRVMKNEKVWGGLV